MALLLRSCLAAETKDSLHLHVHRADVEIVKALIPSSASFTVWDGQEDLAVFEVILDKDVSRELIPLLARNGAQRISVALLGMLYK